MTKINDHDRKHLQSFPSRRKAQVIQKIMSLSPVQNATIGGGNQFELAVFKLHREGYQLIDMQPHEMLLTTVWYRKRRSLLRGGAEVIMLLWEYEEDSHSTTTMKWKI